MPEMALTHTTNFRTHGTGCRSTVPHPCSTGWCCNRRSNCRNRCGIAGRRATRMVPAMTEPGRKRVPALSASPGSDFRRHQHNECQPQAREDPDYMRLFHGGTSLIPNILAPGSDSVVPAPAQACGRRGGRGGASLPAHSGLFVVWGGGVSSFTRNIFWSFAMRLSIAATHRTGRPQSHEDGRSDSR